MKKFKKSDTEIWEDTGEIKVYNFPPKKGTYSYITRVYTKYVKNKAFTEAVEGEPMYFHQLSTEQEALAKTIAIARDALSLSLNYESYLDEIE